MKQMEKPEIVVIWFGLGDVLTASESTEPTDETGGGEVTTPEDEF